MLIAMHKLNERYVRKEIWLPFKRAGADFAQKLPAALLVMHPLVPPKLGQIFELAVTFLTLEGMQPILQIVALQMAI